MLLLIYLPVSAQQKAAPVFTLLNFFGNYAIHPDPAIVIPEGYVPPKQLEGSTTEKRRGFFKSAYPAEKALAGGFGVATLYSGDVDPDFHDEFKNGIHPLLDPPGKRSDDAWVR
ncbi:MAG: hypothetical protein NTV46_02125 [Verrucomicrobia bacterium]|nr:hypothetical protein [Verrucomicrobiota bacterium]